MNTNLEQISDWLTKILVGFGYNKSAPNVYFWNIIDQVLIRPELLSRFESIDS